MNPEDIGKAYDQITHLWETDQFDRKNGIDQHKRAIEFVSNRGNALDVGCGSTGRIIDLLLKSGFSPEGVDISSEMLKLARQKHPNISFYREDICEWTLPKKYDFITAWDSIWHIPLSQQKNVLLKLVASLSENGVFLLSFGGTDTEASHTDDSMGPEVYYSTLGVNGFLKLFIDSGCVCRHLEYERCSDVHAYLIIQKS
ncbi:MAG: class I SAM-dependent methyltransferase [Gammaproteobacteria bacterium]|nr:class I SAM-dependent methyltransferase [Gammaproteobacteria bacterium]